MEMLESGELPENRIPFREIQKKKSFFADLIAVFNSGNTANWQPSLHNPFFHLKTNGFWHLDPPELQSRPAGGTPTEAYLRNVNATAKLDERLFVLLVMPQYREILRQVLISTYFSNIRHEIEQVIEKHRNLRREHIEGDIEGYSEQLIQDTQRPFSMQRDVASIQVETPVRSAGFRKAIMKIYEYKCAVCELDIRTTSGASITDAAHIIPFSVSYNDDVRNGLSLCKSHHWAFDARLFSLNETYHVIVPPISHEHEPTERMLSELRDQRIWTPSLERHRPHQEALTWHRERVMGE
ncbi:MAG: HNH endonuclease [Candidatus Poribacteria bacterium]|nr:HNH endonuclease [Candidatus Poribacteria bacterium]